MREYCVIIEDDVEDYFINLLQFVAGNSTLDFALRYVNRFCHIAKKSAQERSEKSGNLLPDAGNALRVGRHRNGQDDGGNKAVGREDTVLYYSHYGIKKEIDRLARSEGHRQIVDV